MADGLLIAQISDTHIGGAVAQGSESNLDRLDRTLAHLQAVGRTPDLLLVTGDMADAGGDEPYRLLKDRLDRLPFPARVALGNHDERAPAQAVFGGGEGGFFHYAFDAGELRVVVLDTVEEGRHGGAFCAEREAWLRDQLHEAAAKPVLVALHHPPVDIGIDWLTTSPTEPWLERLDAALADHPHIVALISGHVHRPIVSSRAGRSVRVCPPVAAQLALDLAPLSPDRPDGRALIVEGRPGYALHLWRGGTLTTHFGFVEEQRAVLRFDEKTQPFVRSLFEERSA